MAVFSGCTYIGLIKDPFTDIPNFHKVNSGLYRGGRPSPQGLKELRDMGIKTIINLSSTDDNHVSEELFSKNHNIKLLSIPISVLSRPKDEDVLLFLETTINPKNHPVYVHCSNGRDRTGTMIAVYRATVDGHGPKEAYKEAKRYGFWPYQGDAVLKNFIHQLKDKKNFYKFAKDKLDLYYD